MSGEFSIAAHQDIQAKCPSSTASHAVGMLRGPSHLGSLHCCKAQLLCPSWSPIPKDPEQYLHCTELADVSRSTKQLDWVSAKLCPAHQEAVRQKRVAMFVHCITVY